MTKPRDTKYGLDYDRVNEVLSYDPATGIFRWKIKLSDRAPVGKRAGGRAAGGHWRIKIDGYYYLAHRLAWLLMKGVWPPAEVDHENRTRDDNRWLNLRDANHSQNHANCDLRSDNTTGFKGVQFCKQKQRFIAIAVKDGERHYAGTFSDPVAAHSAYSEKSRQLHGEFHFAGAV